MIELSDKKYWKKLKYYDALLYCQVLEIDGKNDWRMIKNWKESAEVVGMLGHAEKQYNFLIWQENDVDDSTPAEYYDRQELTVIPVRDICKT
jgi:hypothetical protein